MTGVMSSDRANPAPERSTIVGIDEAGYGPLLGPLVVTAVAFDVPVSVLKAVKDPADGPDLWALLRDSVKSTPNRRDPRLAVADSKKLHGQADSGIGLLERAALAFLMQLGDVPTGLRALLERVGPQGLEQMSQYAWYGGADLTLPAENRVEDLRTQSNALAMNLASAGVRFRGAFVELLCEGHYNRLVGATRNKAVVLFGQTTRLVQRVADHVGARPLRVWVDRQGGRIGYGRPLMTAFQDVRLDVLEESEDRSGYRLIRRPASWVIRFVRKGETHHLPVALASIISKYIRELCMICFNRYWRQHVPDLRPTAGYYQDGQRFLADIAAVVERERVDRGLLVRSL